MTPNFEIPVHSDSLLLSNQSKEQHDASAKFLSEFDFSGAAIHATMTRTFNDIDSDEDGLLSSKELKSYKPSAQDESCFRFVRNNFSEIARLYNRDQFFDETKISRNDVAQLRIRYASNLVDVQQRLKDYTTCFVKFHDQLDTDGNKLVSKEELESAIKDPNFAGNVGAKQMVRFYRDNYETLTTCLLSPKLADDGLTRKQGELTGQIMDFNSLISSGSRVQFTVGGAVIGGLGGFMMLNRASQIIGFTVSKPWLAVAAGIGAIAVGGLYLANRVRMEKTIPTSRIALYDVLENELKLGIRSPIDTKSRPGRSGSWGEPEQTTDPISTEKIDSQLKHRPEDGSGETNVPSIDAKPGQRKGSAAKSLLENL